MTKRLYFIDTNCLIFAWKYYYRQSFAPAFGDYLSTLVYSGDVLVIQAVYDETAAGNDKLSEYMNKFKKCVLKPNHEIADAYGEVLNTLQSEVGVYYTDKALKNWSLYRVADPWLIASAKTKGGIIVTQEERNKGGNSGLITNVKIPDVADTIGVPCIKLYDFVEQTGFLWKRNG